MERRSLHPPILCLVTDRAATRNRPLEDVVATAVRAGVRMVQLRDKGLPARQLYDLGRSLIGPVREAGAFLVVNDRVDVAMALEADGVHLGGDSLPVREARKLVGDGKLVGVSTHSLDEALRAAQGGADYLVLGTIFETRSHPGKVPDGLQLVTQVSRSIDIPVLAIGGIDCRNAPSVMEAGVQGVAVISAILASEDVASAVGDLLRAISGASR